MLNLNTGIIHEPLNPQGLYLGGVGSELGDINPSGDWEPYLPEFETQSKLGLQTNNCVQVSFLNVVETLFKLYGLTTNFSDRFLGWASNCDYRYGNTYSNCFNGFRGHGSCHEAMWPWLERLTGPEYYSEPSPEAKTDAGNRLKGLTFGQPIWVPPTVEGLRVALRKSPVLFCNEGHSMMIYRCDEDGTIHVFDSFPGADGDGKSSLRAPWPWEILAAYIIPLRPKESMPEKKLDYPANSLVVVVDTGERLMSIDGTKLYKDEPAKILTELVARNSKDGEFDIMPVVHVKKSDIEGVPFVNLKGETV